MTFSFRPFLYALSLLAAFGICSITPAQARAITHDEAVRVVERAWKRPVDPKWVSIVPLEGFADTWLVSSFAYDRGSEAEGIILDERYGSVPDMMGAVLQRAGWSGATAAQRRALAERWVREVLVAPDGIMDKVEPSFSKGKRTFQSPLVETAPDGSVTFLAWVRGAAGMRAVRSYWRERYTFSADGRTLKTATEQSFEIPF